MVLISRWLKYLKEHRLCRDIIYYVRTFRKKRILSMCRYLYAPPWRAGIINYAPTLGVFSLCIIVKNKVILSNGFADEPSLALVPAYRQKGLCGIPGLCFGRWRRIFIIYYKKYSCISGSFQNHGIALPSNKRPSALRLTPRRRRRKREKRFNDDKP